MKRNDFQQVAQAIDEAMRAANSALNRCSAEPEQSSLAERDVLAQACRHLARANDLVFDLDPDS